MVKTFFLLFFLLFFLILTSFQVSSSFAQPDKGVGIKEVALNPTIVGACIAGGLYAITSTCEAIDRRQQRQIEEENKRKSFEMEEERLEMERERLEIERRREQREEQEQRQKKRKQAANLLLGKWLSMATMFNNYEEEGEGEKIFAAHVGGKISDDPNGHENTMGSYRSADDTSGPGGRIWEHNINPYGFHLSPIYNKPWKYDNSAKAVNIDQVIGEIERLSDRWATVGDYTFGICSEDMVLRPDRSLMWGGALKELVYNSLTEEAIRDLEYNSLINESINKQKILCDWIDDISSYRMRLVLIIQEPAEKALGRSYGGRTHFINEILQSAAEDYSVVPFLRHRQELEGYPINETSSGYVNKKNIHPFVYQSHSVAWEMTKSLVPFDDDFTYSDLLHNLSTIQDELDTLWGQGGVNEVFDGKITIPSPLFIFPLEVLLVGEGINTPIERWNILGGHTLWHITGSGIYQVHLIIQHRFNSFDLQNYESLNGKEREKLRGV